MSFHEQSFGARFGTMGDTAEAVFDLVFPNSHPLGLNRPSFSMRGMTAAHRYTPDRMNQHGVFEVMGIGRDGTLKLKDEKIEALAQWERLGPTHLFVYDQANGHYYYATFDAWLGAVSFHGIADEFHDGKKYRALHRDFFPAPAMAVPDEVKPS